VSEFVDHGFFFAVDAMTSDCGCAEDSGVSCSFLTTGSAALFDHTLARRRVRLRILWTALFAYVATYLIPLTAWSAGTVHGPALLALGLIGMLPGAVCAWLSGSA
jgi:hypothetical protein